MPAANDLYVVVCLGSMYERAEQPGFSAKAYGPFTGREAAVDAQATIKRIEGGACLLRPLVSLPGTLERISRD